MWVAGKDPIPLYCQLRRPRAARARTAVGHGLRGPAARLRRAEGCEGGASGQRVGVWLRAAAQVMMTHDPLPTQQPAAVVYTCTAVQGLGALLSPAAIRLDPLPRSIIQQRMAVLHHTATQDRPASYFACVRRSSAGPTAPNVPACRASRLLRFAHPRTDITLVVAWTRGPPLSSVLYRGAQAQRAHCCGSPSAPRRPAAAPLPPATTPPPSAAASTR
jgi:hypothetical protein